MSIMSKCAALGVAAALAAGSVLVAAGPVQAQASVAVPIADLDLASDGGKALFERRITRAAYQVCGPLDQRVLPAAGLHRVCRTETMAAVRDQLGRVTILASNEPITVTAALR